jgi:hypothetical protein
MVQHESRRWPWGRYVVIYPAANVDFAGVCSRYAKLLTEPTTFASVTLEEVLGAGVLPQGTARTLRQRYLVAADS